MTEFQINSIIKELQNTAKINKTNFDYLIAFLASELVKDSGSIDDDAINLLAENIQNKYYTTAYIANALKDKIKILKSTSADTLENPENSFQLMLQKISKTRSLTESQHNNLRFSSKHLGLLRKIFYLEITQNYLSALKWFITDDIITNQSKFNNAVEDSIKKILSDLESTKKEFSIAITELKNYARDSEAWIHNIEYALNSQISPLDHDKLSSVESKLSTTDNKLSSVESKLSTTDNKLSSVESELHEIHNQISDLESTKKEFSIAITELKNYARDSEAWNHDYEAKIIELTTNFEKLQSKFDELSSATAMLDSKLDALRVPGHLISKIYELESKLNGKTTHLDNMDLSHMPLYFLHIPKTAGTSFIDFLDYFYNESEILKPHDWQQLIPTDNLDVNLVHGHFGYGVYRLFAKKPVYITMLRDPVSRTISDYRQSMRTDDMGVETDFFNNSNLQELVSNSETRWRFTNIQSKQLAVDVDPSYMLNSNNKKDIDNFSRFLIPEYKHPKMSDEEMFSICKTRLKEFAFVGITERFEESMQLLCYTFGWKPIRVNPQLNVSPNDSFGKGLSQQTLDDLKSCNTVDQRLYSLAVDNFDKKFSKMVQELMDSYYDPSLSNLSFKDLLYALIEKNYEDKYWKNKPAVNSISYTFDKLLLGNGWHSREINKNGQYSRWTGPLAVSTIDLPKILPATKKIEIILNDYIDEDTAAMTEFYINDFKIKLSSKINNNKSFVLEGTAEANYFVTSRDFTRVKFVVKKTKPVRDLNPLSPDYRCVGIAVQKISIV